MNYSTFDRFQGAWLGGIVGYYLVSSQGSNQNLATSANKSQDWILARERVARLIVPNLHLEFTIPQIAELMEKTHSGSVSSPLLFSLLPLIMLADNNRKIYRQLIEQLNLKLLNTTEIQKDLLIWDYLVTGAINHKLPLKSADLNGAIENFCRGVGFKENLIDKRYQILGRGVQNGWSLTQLIEQLMQLERPTKNTSSWGGIIIALAFYCFAATPKNFQLSVKRVSHLNRNLVLPVTMLVTTLSGAYNGLAGIPRRWLFALNRDCTYVAADRTSRDLFAAWLGVLDPLGDRPTLYNPEREAVAVPKIIQARSSLQIISQKSDLS